MDVSEFNGTTSSLDTSWHLSPSIFGALSRNLQNKIPIDTSSVGREVTVQILFLSSVWHSKRQIVLYLFPICLQNCMTLDSGRRTTEVRRGMRSEEPLQWQNQHEEGKTVIPQSKCVLGFHCVRKGREVTRYK